MCAVAVICGFKKIRTTRSSPRTASAPIDAISARGRRRPRTHSGQRRHVGNHNRAFPQVGAIFGRNSVNTVKPSAQPTLVRTQHLPPPAKTARDRDILPPRGPPCVVSSSVIVGQETPLHHDGYGHIADGSGPKGAVH